jgi:hypothetical protein
MRSIGLEVMDRREELFFPRAMFFNTSLHLNEDGRRERTEIFINDLRKLGIGKDAAESTSAHPIPVK